MIKRGTHADKISALQMKIQQLKHLGLKYLRVLLTISSQNQKKKIMPALLVLKQEFIDNLLPDKKLRSFFGQDDLLNKRSEELLVKIFIEHEIKACFVQFVEMLRVLTFDNLMHFQKMAIRFLVEILSKKPEQERKILQIIINKFTDPNKEFLNFLQKQLSKLLQKHNRMSIIVAKEIQQLMMRANIPFLA